MWLQVLLFPQLSAVSSYELDDSVSKLEEKFLSEKKSVSRK